MSEVLRDIGPKDVDSAAGLVGRIGVKSQAKELIRRTAAMYPAELVSILSRPVDDGRTRFLDTDEVADAVKDAFGGRKQGIGKVLSARVHGEGAEDQLYVGVVFATDSGRSARGAVRYSELSRSRSAYGSALKSGSAIEGAPDNPDALKAALARAQSEAAQLRQQLEGGSGDGSGTPEPVPVEGYADLKAPQVIDKIDAGELDREQLAEVVKYEADHDGRSTVVEAAQERIALLSPYPEYAESPARDVVAYVKDEGRTEDELKAVRTAEEAGDNRTTVLAALDKAEAPSE